MEPDIQRTDQTDLIDVGDIETPLGDDWTEPPTPAAPDSFFGSGKNAEDPGTPYPAELRDRFAAFSIDLMVLYTAYWPLMLFYRAIALGSAAGPIPAAGIHGILLNGIFLLIALLYFVLGEFIFSATLGKMLCRLSVMKTDAAEMTFLSTLARNILRPLDIILFPTLILTGLMENTPWSRRLGDLAARTMVLKRPSRFRKQFALSLEIIASATRRTAAFAIDIAILAVLLSGYALLLSPETPISSMIQILFLPIILFLFFAIPEIISHSSPGKWILGLSISSEEGFAADLPSVVIRTLWRPFDNNFMGFATALFSSRKQRPGDSSANTIVIKAVREMSGFLILAFWLIISGTFLYFGLNNPYNLTRSDFKINFLPSIDMTASLSSARAEPLEELGVVDFQFSEGIHRSPRQPSIYQPGESVYMTFDVDGYMLGDGKAWIQEDLSITYPDGNVGLKLENINEFNSELERSGAIRFENNIALPADAQPGRYTVTLSIRDRNASKEIKEQRFFYVTPKESSIRGEEPPSDEEPTPTNQAEGEEPEEKQDEESEDSENLSLDTQPYEEDENTNLD